MTCYIQVSQCKKPWGLKQASEIYLQFCQFICNLDCNKKEKRMIYAIDVAEKRESRRHLKNVYNFTVGLSLHIIFLKKIYDNKLSNSIKQRRFFLLNLDFHKDLCKQKLSVYIFGDLICIKWVVSQETKAQFRYHCKKSHEGCQLFSKHNDKHYSRYDFF